jgi:hypothetical protein
VATVKADGVGVGFDRENTDPRERCLRCMRRIHGPELEREIIFGDWNEVDR